VIVDRASEYFVGDSDPTAGVNPTARITNDATDGKTYLMYDFNMHTPNLSDQAAGMYGAIYRLN
jgi:hypothetical protein